MTEVRYEKATLEHAAALAAVMRPADVAEVLAATGETPLQVLERGVRTSQIAITVLFDNEPAVMVGLGAEEPAIVVPALEPRYRCLWFLTGEAVNRTPRLFVRIVKKLAQEFLDVHPRVFNWVDDRYDGAKWLLRHVGVQLSEPVAHGVNGELFRLGTFRRY